MRGRGEDAMGDQWKAALWLVNGLIERDWRMGYVHILIAGDAWQNVAGQTRKIRGPFFPAEQGFFTIQ